ncbi:hypothetical protein WAI453_012065 [Rhynchosporium graminicola]
MSLPLTRSAVRSFGRQLRTPAARRFESSTATKASEATKETASKVSETAKDAASKAGDKAQEFKSKATEGLSKVTSSAGSAAKGLGNALGKVGGRTGKVVAFVERQIPHAIYYIKVGAELSKLVYNGRQMSPPSMSTFQTYFQQVLKNIRNPNGLLHTAENTAGKAVQKPTSVLESFRDRQKVINGAIIGAEVLGFFTVGEMIGRMKIVGYRGDTASHH